MLLRLGTRPSHPLSDVRRHDHSWNFVRHELCIAQRHKRPDSRDDGNALAFDLCEERLELLDVEHRMSNRVLSASVDFPREALELMVDIDSNGIHADADCEACRVSDRVTARIETMIQIVDEIRQPDGIDVEHC